MSWTNVCVEGFCFGDIDKQGNYPCGQDCTSHLCLENRGCPHFAYGPTTEREVAQFPPLRLIIKDRIGIWADELYWKLRWWLWGSLWFNRRKTKEFFDNIPVANCPMIDKQLAKAQRKFIKWFEEVKKISEE